MLVVIVDKRSGVSESSIKAAANTLHAGNVKVIPVAVGNESDSKEAETATEDKNNLIEAPKNFEPNNLAETIMRKVLKGQSKVECIINHQCNNGGAKFVQLQAYSGTSIRTVCSLLSRQIL